MSSIQPSSPETGRRMAKVRQKGTDAEIALRRELYRRSMRYRVDHEVLKKPRRVADVAFPGLKIAIFVDGCFWHGCPEHGRRHHDVNGWYWPAKIDRNRARDRETDQALSDAGWQVIRIWEHDLAGPAAATAAALRVQAALARQRLDLHGERRSPAGPR